MRNRDDHDPKEFGAIMAELRDTNRKAPMKIPAGIYTPPLRANGKRSSWGESAKRKDTNFRNKAYGDLDRRYAEAAARRTEQELLADAIYGGEDEMIEALDEAAAAEHNDVDQIADDRYADHPEAEPLHRPLKTVVRYRKRILKPSEYEVRAKARMLASSRYGRYAHEYAILFEDAARECLQKLTLVKQVDEVEDHEPLPVLDTEERTEARVLSSVFIRERNEAEWRAFRQNDARRQGRHFSDRFRREEAQRKGTPILTPGTKGGRNGGRKPCKISKIGLKHLAVMAA